jgi:hypothetical protein
MKARQLIANAIYDPDELNTIRMAFDAAWEQIAPEVDAKPEAIEAARLKLAEIVLSLTRNGTKDPQQLTDAAVRLMLSDPTPFQH